MDYHYSSISFDGVKNGGGSSDLGVGSHLLGDGSVTLRGGSDTWGDGSKLKGAGSQIRRDPVNFNPWIKVY